MAWCLRHADPLPVVTLDVDWAPDWMIEDVAEKLLARGVRATFFATHQSPAITALRQENSFEIGIHPNFLPNSSHGQTEDEVLGTLLGWFPGAVASRSHSLVQSEPLLAKMHGQFGLKIDCSLHLPRAPGVSPHFLPLSGPTEGIFRIPHIFQDNMHVITGRDWTLEATGLTSPGLKVLNFHPVHICQNTASIATYDALKKSCPLDDLTRTRASGFVHSGEGAGRFFDLILSEFKGRPSLTISQCLTEWQAEAQE